MNVQLRLVNFFCTIWELDGMSESCLSPLQSRTRTIQPHTFITQTSAHLWRSITIVMYLIPQSKYPACKRKISVVWQPGKLWVWWAFGGFRSRWFWTCDLDGHEWNLLNHSFPLESHQLSSVVGLLNGHQLQRQICFPSRAQKHLSGFELTNIYTDPPSSLEI